MGNIKRQLKLMDFVLMFAADTRRQMIEEHESGMTDEFDFVQNMCIFMDAAMDGIASVRAEKVKTKAELDAHLEAVVRKSFPDLRLGRTPPLQVVK